MLIPFNPPPGLNSDDTTFAAEGRWCDGNNVRFWLGRPQVIGGWDIPLTSVPGDLPTFTGTAFDIVATTNVGTTMVVIIGTAGAYYTSYATVYNTSAWLTMKSVTDNSSRQNMQLALFGTTMLMNGDFTSGATGTTSLWAAAYSGGTYAAASEITQAPDFTRFILVTPQRQVLAFACQPEAGGSQNNLCIRGCDFEDYTDWTTSSTNNAFEHILDGPGSLIGAVMVGPYVAVWTDVSLYMGTFLGDPGQTYRFDKVADNCGLRGRRCVQVVDQVAYWVGFDGLFRRWAPGSQPEVIPCPILQDFLDNADDDADGGGLYKFRSWMMVNPKYKEIWFFYPDTRDTPSVASRYLAYSIDQGTWFRGQMARAVGTPAPRGHLIMVDGSSQLFHHEIGNTANGSALNWHIESADQYIDESQRRVMISRIIPDFEDQVGDVSLTLYMRDYPQGSDVTKGPFTLADGADKVDFRASGKIARVRFSGGSASGSYARFGKQLFDITTMGER
jgi:hypothetical protein